MHVTYDQFLDNNNGRKKKKNGRFIAIFHILRQ